MRTPALPCAAAAACLLLCACGPVDVRYAEDPRRKVAVVCPDIIIVTNTGDEPVDWMTFRAAFWKSGGTASWKPPVKLKPDVFHSLVFVLKRRLEPGESVVCTHGEWTSPNFHSFTDDARIRVLDRGTGAPPEGDFAELAEVVLEEEEAPKE
ncbi:MAG: hypothetical protein ACYTAF_05030 [Planctomycetota bacterium]|jgi:hypothetical protein